MPTVPEDDQIGTSGQGMCTQRVLGGQDGILFPVGDQHRHARAPEDVVRALPHRSVLPTQRGPLSEQHQEVPSPACPVRVALDGGSDHRREGPAGQVNDGLDLLSHGLGAGLV